MRSPTVPIIWLPKTCLEASRNPQPVKVTCRIAICPRPAKHIMVPRIQRNDVSSFKKKMKSDFIARISVSRRIFTGANKPSNMVFFTVQPVCAVARWKGRIKLSSLRSHDQPRVVTRSACDGGGGGRGGDTKGRLRSMRKRIRRGKGASLSSCSSTRDTSAVYSSSSSATIPTRIIARTETNEPALLARSLLVGLGTWDVDY
jgi:hypothetical protein